MRKKRNTLHLLPRQNETYYRVVQISNKENDNDDHHQSEDDNDSIYNGINQQGFDRIYMFGDKNCGFKTTQPPQNFHKLRDQQNQNRSLFKDDNFSPEKISLTKLADKVIWKRPCEISSNPEFVIDGASRCDINQGNLGDCWFLAAIANLTTNPRLFKFVVPMDQDFKENYAGIFYFRFWQYGRWIEIVVDDRLPTIDDKLISLACTDPNEFWAPLLEKAYAKLNGSYKHIEGGQISEALEDMCGGFSEFHRASRPEVFDIMKMSYERSSFMGCSIVSSDIEGVRPDGLVTTHAYSVTKVESVMINENEELKLLRLRNPWGKTEWKGAWSDNSECWHLVPEEIRNDLLLNKNDGEFWMEVEEFQQIFTFLDICHLSPSSFIYSDGDNKQWNIKMFDGAWVPHVTAGGGVKHQKTFPSNPQYFMSVKGNDADKLYTVVVGLMQKYRRISGKNELPLEISLYKVETSTRGLLDIAFFKSNGPILHWREDGVRQLTVRMMLPIGKYCIIPSTSDPNIYASYLLRIYSEIDANVTEIDDKFGYTTEAIFNYSSHEEIVFDYSLPNSFKKLHNDQGNIGWEKVQKALNYKYGRQMFCLPQYKQTFSKNSCKNIVALLDPNYDGTLDCGTFWQLMNDVSKLKTIFEHFDEDNSGRLNGFEMRNVLLKCGYKVNKEILRIIMLRFGSKGSLNFENFVVCVFKLKLLIEEFQRRRTDANSVDGCININSKEWLEITLYS